MVTIPTQEARKYRKRENDRLRKMAEREDPEDGSVPEGRIADAERRAKVKYSMITDKEERKQKIDQYVEKFKQNYPIKKAKRIANRLAKEQRERTVMMSYQSFDVYDDSDPHAPKRGRGPDIAPRNLRRCMKCVKVHNVSDDVARRCPGSESQIKCTFVAERAGAEPAMASPSWRVLPLGREKRFPFSRPDHGKSTGTNNRTEG